MKWIAPSDAEERFPTASNEAILPQRFNAVMTAGGMEATMTSQPGAQKSLIEADQEDGGLSRELGQERSEFSHRFPPRFASRFPSRFPSLFPPGVFPWSE